MNSIVYIIVQFFMRHMRKLKARARFELYTGRRTHMTSLCHPIKNIRWITRLKSPTSAAPSAQDITHHTQHQAQRWYLHNKYTQSHWPSYIKGNKLVWINFSRLGGTLDSGRPSILDTMDSRFAILALLACGSLLNFAVASVIFENCGTSKCLAFHF